MLIVDTGLGGLIVLILFMCQLSVSECVKMFDTLVKQLFLQVSDQRDIFNCLCCLLRSWYHDECHDVNMLKAYLKENLEFYNHLFDYVQSLIITKVEVTVTTINKDFLILLTNYNDLDKQDRKCDMLRLRVFFKCTLMVV